MWNTEFLVRVNDLIVGMLGVAYIKGNKLVVNEIVYSIEELEQVDGTEEETIKTNSAPPTPTTHRIEILKPAREHQATKSSIIAEDSPTPPQDTPDTPKVKKPTKPNNITLKPMIAKEKLRSHSTKDVKK
ncbi:hypothetical protein JTB14_027658 [Gonioctena quinquepunctata]|nr:hypothetical protein JTB14_027658 [Gonioctena quinquepunctata]